MYCQENGQIYPRFYNQIIWYFSWFLLLNSWYILSIGYTDLAIQPFLVWVTSILYWRDPQYNSWRRYLDMITCFTMGSYQIIRSVTLMCGIHYYVVLSSGIISYFISFYFYGKVQWLSVLFHLMLHLGVNVSNIILAHCSS